MAKEDAKTMSKGKQAVNNGPMGYFFFMSWVGALIYFVQASSGFGEFLVAILKSFVWPAYVIHSVLGLLGL